MNAPLFVRGLTVTVALVLLVFSPSGLGASLSPAGEGAATSAVSCPVVQPASGNAGPTVECYLNGTGALSWDPNALTAPSNATIIFNVGEVGAFSHDFALDAVVNDTTLQSWTANPSSVSNAQLSSYFANHTAVNLAVNSPSQRNVSKPIHLTASQGTYYFVCLVPGHFESGMWGTLKLQSTTTGGGNATASPNNETLYLIIGAIFVVVIAVAIVLALRFGRKYPTGKPPVR